MHQRWDSKQCRERTMQLLDEQLFFNMYETLKSITDEYKEPCPAQLWDEAANQWKPLLAAKHPHTHVAMLKEELAEEYGERSAFLILMILLYMMVAMFRPQDKSPYRPFCQALADNTKDHPLLSRLWDGIRHTEGEEEKAGKRVGIMVSLLSDMKDSGQTVNLDSVEQSILRLPSYDAQQKALEQADNLLRGTAWCQRSAAVQEKMIALANSKQEALEKIATRPLMNVAVNDGGLAQFSEKDIVNHCRQLPNK